MDNDTSQNNNGQPIIINQKSESNGIGTAGFILSIIGLVAGCIPVIGWLVWLLGLVFSFIGIFKRPRGLAIAGLIISLIGIILLIFLFGGLAILGLASEGLEGM